MDRLMMRITKVLRRLADFFEMRARTQQGHIWQVQRASTGHDMAKHPDESFYREQYLYWIKQVVAKGYLAGKALALDLGCGQGRLTIPLAQYCRKITGVDFTGSAIMSARAYASAANCKNVDFVENDLLAYLKTQGDKTFDLVVCTEVVFFLPEYKTLLDEIYRVLKIDGSVFISFRSQYFDILSSVQQRKLQSARMAFEQREGYLWGGQTWFSWHTKEDIESLLKQRGYCHIDCVGIGVCSGIEGDPLAMIARPSLLSSEEHAQLQEIEISLAKEYVNNGRYILAMAKKQDKGSNKE